MAINSVKKEYAQDRLDVIYDLAEDGREVIVSEVVESGKSWSPEVSVIDRVHNAIPLRLDRKDVKGNVKATDGKYFIDSSHPIRVGMRLKDNDKNGEVLMVDESLGFDGATIIAYFIVVAI